MLKVVATDEIERKIIEDYKQGHSLRTIGKIINRSHIHVWNIIKKINPDILRPPRLWRKYHFTHRYFKDYTSENSYWMGFLDADGYIDLARNRIELKIHSRDIDRLTALRVCVNGDFPIYRYKTRPHVGISMFSKEMVNDLIEKGIGLKSLKLEPPVGIPDDFVRHFIRGYFDGDGSISLGACNSRRLKPSFQIVGPKPLLAWVKERLIEQAGVDSSIGIRFGGGSWRLRIENQRSLAKIRHYFYDNVDESLFMKRKKNFMPYSPTLASKQVILTNPQ